MSKTDYDAVDLLVKNIQSYSRNIASSRPFDKTFPSVVQSIGSDGRYSVLYEGSSYNVACAIPGLPLKTGQSVWIKIPCGSLKDMHICGIMPSSSAGRT